MGIMIKCSCLGCSKRHFGCHSKCSEYEKYKRNLQYIKIQKDNSKDLYSKLYLNRC